MAKQLLRLVFGGELTHPGKVEFADPSKLDIVGIFPSYAEAYKAWRAKAQATIDQAQVRYFVVHLHRLLEPHPDETRPPHTPDATKPLAGREASMDGKRPVG